MNCEKQRAVNQLVSIFTETMPQKTLSFKISHLPWPNPKPMWLHCRHAHTGRHTHTHTHTHTHRKNENLLYYFWLPNHFQLNKSVCNTSTFNPSHSCPDSNSETPWLMVAPCLFLSLWGVDINTQTHSIVSLFSQFSHFHTTPPLILDTSTGQDAQPHTHTHTHTLTP